jgi:hypothetical protein
VRFVAAKGIGKLPGLVKLVSEAPAEALPDMVRTVLSGFLDAIALINRKLDSAMYYRQLTLSAGETTHFENFRPPLRSRITSAHSPRPSATRAAAALCHCFYTAIHARRARRPGQSWLRSNLRL